MKYFVLLVFILYGFSVQAAKLPISHSAPIGLLLDGCIPKGDRLANTTVKPRTPDEARAIKERKNKALAEMKKRADSGDVSAQSWLASDYLNGDGVVDEVSLTDAAKWYRRAAEQGEALAQISLASILMNGCGTKENHVEAAKWFRSGAEQGNFAGQWQLGEMYFIGDGVEQNYVKAYFWTSLARMRVQSDDLDALYTSAKGHLSPEQKAEQDKEVAVWVPKPSGVVLGPRPLFH